MTLHNLGNLHYNLQDYVSAEKEYREALEISRRLVETNPHAYKPIMTKTLKNSVKIDHIK